jgi:hypothetical protein
MAKLVFETCLNGQGIFRTLEMRTGDCITSTRQPEEGETRRTHWQKGCFKNLCSGHRLFCKHIQEWLERSPHKGNSHPSTFNLLGILSEQWKLDVSPNCLQIMSYSSSVIISSGELEKSNAVRKEWLYFMQPRACHRMQGRG